MEAAFRNIVRTLWPKSVLPVLRASAASAYLRWKRRLYRPIKLKIEPNTFGPPTAGTAGAHRLTYQTSTDVPCCPLCGHSARTLMSSKSTGSPNSDYVKCQACEHVYVSPLELERSQDIGMARYTKDFSEIPVHGFIEFAQELENYIREVSPEILAQLPGRRRFLDVGCAAGYFLDVMRARGWNVIAIELANELVDWGRKYLDLDIRRRPIEDNGLRSQSIDAVALSEVIEHLPYPVVAITECYRILRHGGVILITCPNFFGGMDFEEQGWEWAVLDPVQHIQCFTAENLAGIVKQTGFEDIQMSERGTRRQQLMLLARKP